MHDVINIFDFEYSGLRYCTCTSLFVDMKTVLFPSFSLFILFGNQSRPLSQTKLGDLQSHKYSNGMHPIFSHQRVWWPYCCHANFGHCQVNFPAPLTHSLFFYHLQLSSFCLNSFLSFACIQEFFFLIIYSYLLFA